MPRKDVNDNFYKIRHTETGLYSTGGQNPRWTKVGKTWTKIGHLKCHLNGFESIPDTWEVIELEQRPASTKPATEYFTPPVVKAGYYNGRTKLSDYYMGNKQQSVNIQINMPTPAQMQASVAQAQVMVNQILQGLQIKPMYQASTPSYPTPTFKSLKGKP
jgi:hypothetical protein